MTLDSIIAGIRPGDHTARAAVLRRWDGLAKPLGSLGALEDDIVRIAALTGHEEVSLDRRCLLVFCADNGVVSQGVSQSNHTVTTAVASALGRSDSTVNYMASAAGCSVLPVDVGMESETPPGVLSRKIRRGTADISKGPAMTRAECIQAILLGVEMAVRQAEAGTDLLLLGEMGIGNTTTSAAVAGVLLDRLPGELAGRGAGLSDAGLERKLRSIEAAIHVNQPERSDPIDVLQKVGGLDLAALCGVCLGGAYCRVPVLLDGVITNVAALCAVRLCPDVKDALIASHVSAEPAAKLLLEELELAPVISAGLRLGEGSGAVLALPLLDQALAVYRSGHTFGALGIDAYTRWEEIEICSP